MDVSAPDENEIGEIPVEEIAARLAPGHPASHGRIGVAVRWAEPAGDGTRRVAAAAAVIGSVHRGAEKLAEVRDYRQTIMLLDRHDWWAPFGSELGFVLLVERMVGLSVPARATWLRTVLAELTRCSSHLAMLAGALDTELPRDPAAAVARDALAVLRELFTAATGNRVHLMFCRIGGVAADVPPSWPAEVSAALPLIRDAAARAGHTLSALPGGVAVLGTDQARAMAVTGPVARAAGVDVDLRRDEPYLGYGEVFAASDVVRGTAGDAVARLTLMADEVAVACDITGRCLAGLPVGAVRARLPRTLRVPEGAGFAWTESPQGASGYFLHSTGGPAAHRLKIRASMFDTAAALSLALPGTRERDLPLALASLPLIAGDIDR